MEPPPPPQQQHQRSLYCMERDLIRCYLINHRSTARDAATFVGDEADLARRCRCRSKQGSAIIQRCAGTQEGVRSKTTLASDNVLGELLHASITP